MRWAIPLDTDPVLGHYRPTPASEVGLPEIVSKAGEDLKSLLEKEKDPKLASLLSAFARKAGLSLDIGTLRQQVSDKNLDPEVRIANLKGLIARDEREDDLLLLKLSKDENELLRAASFGHLLDRGLDLPSSLSLKALRMIL